ncbi:MAG: hypothetical protein IJ642_06760, partial [Oscillospiraceae bacterium]|nr:hypothetical protein [Oscillospiraceae bacterium]
YKGKEISDAPKKFQSVKFLAYKGKEISDAPKKFQSVKFLAYKGEETSDGSEKNFSLRNSSPIREWKFSCSQKILIKMKGLIL